MSQAVIGNLRVNLGLDTAQFSAGAKRAQGSLASLSGSLKGLAMGAAAGAAAALTGLGLAMQKSLGRMDELGKAAQKVGIPVDELSRLEYAARLSDVSLESLTTTLARFSRSLSEIQSGANNSAGEALRQLGINATDAQGRLRPTSAIIEDVAARFSAMEDGAQKTALAIALFGKSGADMIPLLNGGREAIRAAGDELQRFGGVVTPEAAAAAETFNDNLTRLQAAGDGMAQQITVALLPAMNQITSAMVDFAAQGQVAEQAATAISFVMTEAGKGAIFLSQAFTEVAEMATFLGQAFEKLAAADFAGVSDAWAASQARVKAALEANTAAMRALNAETQKSQIYGKGSLPGNIDPNTFQIRPQNAPAVSTTPGSLKRTAEETAHPLAIPQIPPSTIDNVYGYGEAVRSVGNAFNEADPAANQFGDTLGRIGSAIEMGLSEAISGLISGTMDAKEAFAQMAQSIINTLSDLAAQLIASGLMKLLTGALGGGMGAGFNIGGMSFGGLYANGGTLGAGQWGIAGEAGPEIIHGPARITPMDRVGGNQVAVTVINNTPARVNTRQGADGGLTIEVVEDAVATAISRGGNKIDAAMTRGYGLRRAGR